jgi:protein SCO1
VSPLLENGGSGVRRSVRRGLLWGVLVAALLLIFGATLVQRFRSAPPPPVLGAVPDFRLTNRDGRTIARADLAGAPWIADFIFTRCPATCPLLTAKLGRFEDSLPSDLDVRLVSFSVDPEHDTPEVLQAYAARYDAPARWLFLTGEREAIYRLSLEGFHLAVGEPPPDAGERGEPILHSTRFVLVDGEGRIRGYYDGLDDAELDRLRRELDALL